MLLNYTPVKDAIIQGYKVSLNTFLALDKNRNYSNADKAWGMIHYQAFEAVVCGDIYNQKWDTVEALGNLVILSALPKDWDEIFTSISVWAWDRYISIDTRGLRLVNIHEWNTHSEETWKEYRYIITSKIQSFLDRIGEVENQLTWEEQILLIEYFANTKLTNHQRMELASQAWF